MVSLYSILALPPSTLVYLVLSSQYFVTLCFYLCYGIYNSLHFRLLCRLNNITTGYEVLLFFTTLHVLYPINDIRHTDTHKHTPIEIVDHQFLMGNEWPRCAINGLEDILCPLSWNAKKNNAFSVMFMVRILQTNNFVKKIIKKMTKRMDIERRERDKTLYWFKIIYAIRLTLRFNSILKWIVWRMNERHASSFSPLWQLKDPWREKSMWSIVFDAEQNHKNCELCVQFFQFLSNGWWDIGKKA